MARRTAAKPKPLPEKRPAKRRRHYSISPPEKITVSPSYGRFVSFMRVLLPTVATGLLVAVAVWPQINQQDKRFSISPAKIGEEAAKNLTMVNARYTGVDEQQRPYTVTADSARQPTADATTVGLDQPKADILLEDGSWAALTARDGSYNRENQLLELRGGVNVFHDKGYEFKTDTAVIDLKAGDARGVDPVNGQGPFGSIRGQGFVIHNRGARIEFTGKSKLIFYPERVKASK